MKGTSKQLLLTPATLADKNQSVMTTYQAIQKFNYVKPNPVFIEHARVIELHPETTAAAAEYNRQKNIGQLGGLLVKERKQECREFKCLDCGMTWVEHVNSPLIVTQSEIYTYYPHSKKCSILK